MFFDGLISTCICRSERKKKRCRENLVHKIEFLSIFLITWFFYSFHLLQNGDWKQNENEIKVGKHQLLRFRNSSLFISSNFSSSIAWPACPDGMKWSTNTRKIIWQTDSLPRFRNSSFLFPLVFRYHFLRWFRRRKMLQGKKIRSKRLIDSMSRYCNSPLFFSPLSFFLYHLIRLYRRRKRLKGKEEKPQGKQIDLRDSVILLFSFLPFSLSFYI